MTIIVSFYAGGLRVGSNRSQSVHRPDGRGGGGSSQVFVIVIINVINKTKDQHVKFQMKPDKLFPTWENFSGWHTDFSKVNFKKMI